MKTKQRELSSEREIDMIRGKIEAGVATETEAKDFLFYVEKLEEMVEQASMEDFYGTWGWKARLWGKP